MTELQDREQMLRGDGVPINHTPGEWRAVDPDVEHLITTSQLACTTYWCNTCGLEKVGMGTWEQNGRDGLPARFHSREWPGSGVVLSQVEYSDGSVNGLPWIDIVECSNESANPSKDLDVERAELLARDLNAAAVIMRVVRTNPYRVYDGP